MIKKQMRCKECKGIAFGFFWGFKDKKEERDAAIMHDGFGLQLTDAIIKCMKCGTESPYKQEDFLEVVEVN